MAWRFVVFSFLMISFASCSRLPLSVGERLEKVTGLRPQAVRPETVLFAPRWIKNHDPIYSSGNLPIGINEPLVNQGVVFIGDNNGYMRAYDLENGRPLWEAHDESTYHSSPIAYQDQIIYGTVQGRVVSRHRSSGEAKYEIDLGASIESPGVVANGRILFHLRNHQIFCLDVETGKILWAYRRSVPYQTTIQRASTPVVRDHRVYIGFADGQVAAFSLEDGLMLWERKISSAQKFVDVDTDPVFFMNHLYMGSHTGQYTVMDPQSGNILYQMPHTVSRKAIPWNDQLVFGTAEGKVVMMGRDFREARSTTLKGGITSLALWRGVLVASTTTGHLYALNPETFDVLEKFSLGHVHSSVFGEIKVEGDRLVVLSSRNRLYTF